MLQATQKSLKDAEALAQSLSRKAGLPDPKGLTRLAGGRNNQAFEVAFDEAEHVVLKRYHHDPRDPRHRLQAEWSFLNYVWERGVRNVPKPICKDDAAHAALIGFVAGQKPIAEQLDKADIDQAAFFIATINQSPRDVMKLAPGSEACFALDQHIATVDRRVERIRILDPTVPHASEAQRLVDTGVQPAWAEIRKHLLQRIKADGWTMTAELPTRQMCISPSDFGFHNALRDNQGNITFIDFEYAGRDDPAKLICDFLCQPEIPVRAELMNFARDRLSSALNLGEDEIERSKMLYETYCIKWICIMLNEFLSVGGARRAFAEGAAPDDRFAAQILKVRRSLTRLSETASN